MAAVYLVHLCGPRAYSLDWVGMLADLLLESQRAVAQDQNVVVLTLWFPASKKGMSGVAQSELAVVAAIDMMALALTLATASASD